MGFNRVVYLELMCDKCSDTDDVDVGGPLVNLQSYEEARKSLGIEGWTFDGDKCYCPNCSKLKQKHTDNIPRESGPGLTSHYLDREEKEERLRALPNKQRLAYHQIAELVDESQRDWERGELSPSQHEKFVELIQSTGVGNGKPV